jgi:diguanylate cyclase (GGDEF)-like protein
MAPWVHTCPFCAWHRPGATATMLAPSCPDCGGTLRAVPVADHVVAREEDTGPAGPQGGAADGTTVLAALVVLPFLLPVLGIGLGDVAYLVPVAMLAFAAAQALHAGRRAPAWRWPWLLLATAAMASAAASVLALVSAAAGAGPAEAAFHLGAAGSAGLLGAAVLVGRRSRLWARRAALVDTAVVGLVAGALAAWFVVLPGLRGGDVALTLVVVADLAALALFALSAVARRADRTRPADWWLTGAALAAVAGDTLVSVAATGQLAPAPVVTAMLWAAAGFAIAVAADHGLADAPASPGPGSAERRWVAWRVVVPLGAVLTLPAVGLALSDAGRLTPAGDRFFAIGSVAALVLAFGRQAHLLRERHAAVLRERRVRREAVLHSRELEALTGLATTMTQTLEEAPIVEQALGVLHTAARATSSALHVEHDGGVRLAAAAGRWHTEREWAPRGPLDAPETTERGQRAILRLPLAARGRRIGTVTFVRPAAGPFDARGVELLRLLVDQMAVAVQNARDYREKLEQAIRDPLTGVYNRRFLLEALDKEVHRSERYGSEASLVIFDVDDFKLVNDRHGHATGDAVLRAIAASAEGVVRPADSFARIGGEEFALLLPETGQLEALLVAERVRAAVARCDVVPGRRVTLSGGVASCPADARTAEELQRRADAALYWAKRNGKDLCAVAREAGELPDGAADGLVAHLYALVAALDGEHAERVAACAVAVAGQLGLDAGRTVRLRRAAMLHDVGRIATGEDGDHAAAGARMLAHAGLEEEAGWVRAHHDAREEGCAREARILAAADAYVRHGAGRSPAEAVRALREGDGGRYDAAVLAALAAVAERGPLAVPAPGR